MQKAYQRINWENEPSTATPINEDNLNAMDYSLNLIDDRVIELAAYKETMEEKVTQAAASATAAALSESNASASESNAATSETNAATSESNAATSEANALSSANSASASESNAATSESNAAQSENNAEAWAVGQRNGVEVESTDVTYHNNSKYYSEQSGNSASSAETSATNASNSATSSANSGTLSESWAKGGTTTRTGEDTDNSKYYAEKSASDGEAWSRGSRGGQAVPSTDETYNNNSRYYALLANDYKNQAKQYRDEAQAIVGIDIATTETAGIVKPDGDTITVESDGTIRGSMGIPDTEWNNIETILA